VILQEYLCNSEKDEETMEDSDEELDDDAVSA